MRNNAIVLPGSGAGLGRAVIAATAAVKPDPNNAAEILAAMKQDFEDFKAANDKREKDRDVLLDEKVEKINASIEAHQKQLEETLNKQAKQLAALETLGAHNDNDTRRQHARNFMVQNAANLGFGRDAIQELMNAEPDLEKFGRYEKAFNALLAAGGNPNGIRDAELRNDVSIGVDSEGGYLVPPNQATDFVKRLHESSPVRQLANVIPSLGNTWEYPIDTDRLPAAGWVAEKAPRPKTDSSQVRMGKIEAEEAYVFPQITQRALEDRMIIDPARWLQDKGAEALMIAEANAFVSGDGVGKPRGFLSHDMTTEWDKDRDWGKLQYVPSGAAGAFPTAAATGDNPDCLIDALMALKPEYRTGAAWAMNRLTESSVRKLKDADGNYRWSPPVTAGGQAILDGYPVWNFEDMPDIAADSLSIAFGNFGIGYTILDRLGLSLLIDPYTNKPFVGFYMRKRVGGDVTNFDAIKLIKFATS